MVDGHGISDQAEQLSPGRGCGHEPEREGCQLWDAFHLRELRPPSGGAISVTARLFGVRWEPSADLVILNVRTANVANPRIVITAALSPTSPVTMYRHGAP